jgi:hypothetical protein
MKRVNSHHPKVKRSLFSKAKETTRNELRVRLGRGLKESRSRRNGGQRASNMALV